MAQDMKEEKTDAPNIPEAFLKPYDAKSTEAEIYALWEKSGYFNPDNLPGERSEAYSIVLPPPNVTGTLHMGHASMLAIEDVFVRFKRMQGYKTLWIPGTDSAAIATQTKVEKIIDKEGSSRKEMGREAFLARVNAFALESQDTILNQTRRMGSSLDWSRLAYTLDDVRYKAVMEAFVRMYEAGLIYRGDRIVNWDPKGQTVISDDEIIYKEEKTKFYYFQYGPFVIGTSRPETKFGDKYVVMHPDDARYEEYTHGQHIELEWINGPITATVIKDESIDMEFGTGVMTITPWHSQVDFEIAERHGLEKEQIIDSYGKLLPIAEEFAGQKIAAAREAIVEKLRGKGLLVKEEDYTHNVATAERSEAVIEPQIMRQWFVAVNKEFTIPHSEIPGVASGSITTLKEVMRKAVESKAVTIFPENNERVYFHWIDNLRDWCISRQIWFGHRIPVWYDITDSRNANGILHYERGPIYDLFDKQFDLFNEWAAEAVDNTEPIPVWAQFGSTRIINFRMAQLIHEKMNLDWKTIKEGSELKTQNIPSVAAEVKIEKFTEDSSYIQDPDTLDTWFSSGLWTFSTLGWPEKTKDLATFHPTAILETGYDILFFWVARMILMSGFHLGTVPFRFVYLHGLVRDGQGRKMSKSLGNIIDPLDMIEKYGADATRLSLLIQNTPGTDLKLSEDRVRGYKHFANKLWNITRFVLTSTVDIAREKQELNQADTELRKEFTELVSSVTDHFDRYRIDLASDQLYHYAWHRFADEILEESKPILSGTDAEAKASRQALLLTILTDLLKLLHPFMPFVTESIWQQLPKEGGDTDILMIAEWPKQV